MKTPRRRERDETRKLPDMGKALGWDREANLAGEIAVKTDDNYTPGMNAFIPGERPDNEGGVKVLADRMDDLERKKKNTREDRRVEQTKSGFLAQSGSGWAESQAKGEKRPVVKINSGK
jgi:hypothetical protein